MIIFYFNQKLNDKQKQFWTNFIKNTECEIQESALEIKKQTLYVVKLNKETIPLRNCVNIISYLKTLKESTFIQNGNNMLDNFGIILKKDFQNMEQIKTKKLLNAESNESLLFVLFKVALKRKIEDYQRGISKELLEKIYSNNYLFARKFDENSKVFNMSIYDYIAKVTDNNNGINRLDKIYIINLEHRKDRLDSIMKELNKVGANINKIHRINAVYNKEFGALGCGESHILALSDGIKNKYENILILEDDFILNVLPNNFNEYIDRLYNEQKEWDVVMLSANLENVAESNVDFLLKVNKARTTSGYIINKNMMEKVNNNFKEACEYMKKSIDINDSFIKEIMEKNTNLKNIPQDKVIKNFFAIDMYWQQLQKNSNWYCFKERLGIQLPSYSDVENRFTQYGV
jgi:GR25 family glycosyltransferase involved in LPS biosynthesis